MVGVKVALFQYVVYIDFVNGHCLYTTFVFMLRGIDGFPRSIDCAAPSINPLIAHLSINRAAEADPGIPERGGGGGVGLRSYS